MRKAVFNTFLLVVAGLSAIILTSCESEEGGTSEKDLYGSWTLDDVEFSNINVGGLDIVLFLEVTFDYSQTDAETALAIISADIDSSLSILSGTVTFNEDNTYKVMLTDEIDEGTWFLSTEGKTLSMQSNEPGEPGEDLIIENVSPGMLVLILESEEGEADFDGDDIEETTLNFEVRLTFSR